MGTTVAVPSASSARSNDMLTVPLLPAPSKPVEVVTQVILPTPVPVHVV